MPQVRLSQLSDGAMARNNKASPEGKALLIDCDLCLVKQISLSRQEDVITYKVCCVYEV